MRLTERPWTALENRAYLRLVQQLPPAPGAPRPHLERISGLLSYRVPVNHAEVFLKPVYSLNGNKYEERGGPERRPETLCQNRTVVYHYHTLLARVSIVYTN